MGKMDTSAPTFTSYDSPDSNPPVFNWVLGFLLVGAAWGLTTPFMRRGAIRMEASSAGDTSVPARGIIPKLIGSIKKLLANPGYLVPLLLNITGSIWFFLLIGQAELSLTVPVTNSLAFLFTVLGDWWVDGTVIEKHTLIGMTLVLAGITSCVYAKA